MGGTKSNLIVAWGQIGAQISLLLAAATTNKELHLQYYMEKNKLHFLD